MLSVALLLLAVNIVVSRMVGTLQAVVVIRYAGELLYSTDPFTRNRKYWPRLAYSLEKGGCSTLNLV